MKLSAFLCRTCLLTFVVTGACALGAQADPASPAAPVPPAGESAASGKPLRWDEDARDRVGEDAVPAEVKRRYPGLDLEDKHNIRRIRSPDSEAERHTYTLDMLNVLRIWISLGLGATLEKLIDEQLDKDNESRTHNPVLHAVAAEFMLSYPPGLATNAPRAKTHYLKAIEAAKPHVYPLVRAHLALYQINSNDSSIEARDHVNAALEAMPGYVEALLVRAYLHDSRLKDPNQVIADCKAVIATPDCDDRLFNDAIALFKTNAPNETYLPCLKEHFDATATGVRKARFAVYICGSKLRLGKDAASYTEALTLAEQALTWFKPQQAPLLAWQLTSNIAVESLGRLARLATDAGKRDEAAALHVRIQEYLRMGLAIDLEHFTVRDAEKGDVPVYLAEFLLSRGKTQEALDALMDYDGKATLLAPEQRARLRNRILNVRQELGHLPVQRWLTLDEDRLVDEWKLLAARIDAKQAIKLGEREAMTLFIAKIAGGNRKLSAYAARFATLGAVQEASETFGIMARDEIVKRLGKEHDVKTFEQAEFACGLLRALKSLKGKESALAILDYIDVIVKAEDFATNPNKKGYVFPAGIPLAYEASGLDETHKPADKADAKNYADWAAKVRAALKPQEPK